MWPIVYTNFLLRCLVDAVAVCTRDSPRIISIVMDGIPLPSRYTSILCSGLKSNETLTHLSLTKCRIGDNGCRTLLESLRNNPNLRVLNLSGCRLTKKSAESIYLFLKWRRADLLQHVWTESSAGSSGQHSEHGLQTLILNQNPKFGDMGLRQLMYAVKFDCWLKSLSLKRCGITKIGADDIIDVLKANDVLTRVDLTRNQIPIRTFQVICRLLKRRQDSKDDILPKKRVFVNWKKVSIRKMAKDNTIRGSAMKNDKQFIDATNDQNAMKKFASKRFPNAYYRPKLSKEKNEQTLKKKNLRELESQLLDIRDSNRELMKELVKNKALLDAVLQERSRTENEMQRVCLQLNDLRSKVIMVNCLRSKLSVENQMLQRGLRHFFEKLGNLLIAERTDNEK